MSIIINTVYDSVILRTIVKRYWWWPALFVCFFGLFAFVYLRYTKPIYESSMVLQLGDSDKAKDVIDIENINTKDDEISGVVELLRSELLFDKALSALNLNVSLYARGEILTEEKYLSSSFNVQPYDLYDSTLINKEIQVTCISDSKIELIYEKGGKTKRLGGNINEHLKNKDFDIVVKTTDPKKFRTVSEGNELFFVFNGRSELSQRLIADLSVNAIDPNAKTISISFRGHNAQLCHDIVQAVSNTFVNFDEDQNRRSSENVLSFIDSQLDSLSYEVKNAKDSLVVFQRAAQIGDPDAAGLNLSENLGRLEDQLFDANEEYRALISIRQSLKDNPNRLETYKLLPDLLGRSFERSLLSHIQQLQGYLEEKEDLIYSGALAGNSKLESIESKIDSKMELIKRSIDAVEARLTKNRKAIKDKITQVKGESFALPEKRM
jgi:tyrosine-protein kinase Etk/Wzc